MRLIIDLYCKFPKQVSLVVLSPLEKLFLKSKCKQPLTQVEPQNKKNSSPAYKKWKPCITNITTPITGAMILYKKYHRPQPEYLKI